jgi:hypothetical protein
MLWPTDYRRSEMLTEGQQAKFDYFESIISGICYRAVDPDHNMESEAGALREAQEYYDSCPEEVQREIRAVILSRELPFQMDTGWSKCPDCIKGRTSPSEERFIPKLDAQGNQVYQDVLEPVLNEDGTMATGDDGKAMQRVVGREPVMQPIAVEKQLCVRCGGSGELHKDAVPAEPVEMTPEEIEAKFGVKVRA